MTILSNKGHPSNLHLYQELMLSKLKLYIPHAHVDCINNILVIYTQEHILG